MPAPYPIEPAWSKSLAASKSSRLFEREAFAAAAETSFRTGCPVITHTERGTAGEEQIRLLLDGGADPVHVVLSHAEQIAGHCLPSHPALERRDAGV